MDINTGLGNSVFFDLNANGIQDEGEFGADGIIVKLLNSDGSAVLDSNGHPITTTTDGHGAYSFTGLSAGEYKVQFVAPEGFTFTTANAGGDDALDSDANPFNNGISQTVIVTDGYFNDTLDAGLVRPAGIGNLVFEDTNANGIQDDGENGIAGVEVKLLADTDNDGHIDDVVKTTTTNADGSYEFNNLTQGDYRVMFTQPEGFDSVSPFQAGFDVSEDSDANPDNSLVSDVISLDPGDFETKIDAGFYQKTPGIGNSVFFDDNANGIQDADETGTDGVLVKLLNTDGSAATDSDGNPITTTTDVNGNYAFFNLTPGEYKVMFVAPEGFTFTNANVGNDDTVDSDANAFTGITQSVVVQDGEFNDTLDAGLVRPAGIGNFVFKDTNANGIQDIGEKGIAGVEVKLLTDTDNDGHIDDVVKTTTTAADGSYNFNGLTQGDYRVMFTQPEGFDSVSPFQAGFDVSEDSDADSNDGLMSDVISLDPGDFETKIDAGFYNTASLGNSVFIDGNANGIQDADEYNVDGVLVKLLKADGSAALDSDGNPITTTTDVDGAYSFTGITPGEYKVMFVAPEGFTFTNANVGDDDTVDSDANPFTGITQSVVLNSGDFNDTLDVGLVRPAGIGNLVFEDANANGIQDDGENGIAGVEVKLLADTDNDGHIDDVVLTTTTDADGSYNFNNLTQGDYRVMFTQPEGFDSVSPFQAGFDVSEDSDANPDNSLVSDVISLDPGDFETKIDAGFYQKTPGIGNSVFFDDNANGIKDADETGTDGVLVKLLNPDGSAATDSDGNPITTTTDVNGNYAFFNLTPGEYKVMFVAPEGFTFTNANVGNDDTVDSDANAFTGITQSVVIQDGEFNDTLDAGLVRPAGIGNFVFEDTNANGIQDAGENGIAGVEVKLLTDTDNDGQIDDVVKTTTTDANGSYEFNGLTQGDYRVMFTQPEGFDSVSPFQAGFDVSEDSDADSNNGLMSDVISLNPGDFEIKIDAGFYKTAVAQDVTFNFNGQSHTNKHWYGNTRTFNSDGVAVEVSAFRSDKGGNHFDQAYLGDYNSGLGVTNKSDSNHAVDNYGSLDYILFEFDQDVVIDQAFLNHVGRDSDISVWIGDRDGADIAALDSNLLASFTKENNFTHSSRSRWADVNADDLSGDTVILSAYTNGSNDSFKLNKLDITAYVAPNNSTPTEYLYEAEDMSLFGYRVEHLGSDIASGGEAIKLLGHYGKAAVNFEGAAGEYDIVIGYYDENDGHARGSLKVDDQYVDSWSFNQHTSSHLATADNFMEHTIENVHLETGDELKLMGQRSYNEFARFDYIKVIESDVTNVYADTSVLH